MITRNEISIKTTGSDNGASVNYGGRRYRASCTSGAKQAAVRLAEKVALAEGADSAVVEDLTTVDAGLKTATLVMTFKPVALKV